MRQKVIYIAGRGHSGSTLLDLLLGSHSRVTGVGEVTEIGVKRMLLGGQCTCGSAFSDCSVWSQVIPQLQSEPPPPVFIREVLRASGTSIYLESTKRTTRLINLLACPELDVHVVHLIRDLRANAYSFKRKGKNFYSRARRWHKNQVDALDIAPDRRITVYYEDLATRPDHVLEKIMAFCGEEFEPAQMNYTAVPHHNITGNRMRFEKGGKIAPDIAYLDAINIFQWWIASALGLRSLLRHNYPLTKTAMRLRLKPTT